MSGHRRKRCWFCAQEGVRRTFQNRTSMRAHILTFHEDVPVPSFRLPKKRKIPDVVHYGARMRRKLGLEYDRAGHLRPILEGA